MSLSIINRKHRLFIFSFIFFVIICFLPLMGEAAEPTTDPYQNRQPNLELQVPILGYTNAANIAEYIGKIYEASLWIILPIIIVMIMFGGALWALSGGDKKLIGTAKDYIKNSFIGLGIVLFSYIFLSLIGITEIRVPGMAVLVGESLPPDFNTLVQLDMNDTWGTPNQAGVGGKNAKEICQNIMKKTDLVTAYKNTASKCGIEWEILAALHFRERNNAISDNPFQFDARVNKYGKRPECRVWPTALDCVCQMLSSLSTKDPAGVFRCYNCGCKGCSAPKEYFYVHNDPDNGKILRIHGTLENGQKVDAPDKRPGALIIYNALKGNCP